MIGGNFSEPSTTSIIGERPLATRVRRTPDGWRITGKKMFASMIGASREMVGRVLKELEDHAVITMQGKTMVVHLGRAAPRVPVLVLPRHTTSA